MGAAGAQMRIQQGSKKQQQYRHQQQQQHRDRQDLLQPRRQPVRAQHHAQQYHHQYDGRRWCGGRLCAATADAAGLDVGQTGDVGLGLALPQRTITMVLLQSDGVGIVARVLLAPQCQEVGFRCHERPVNRG